MLNVASVAAKLDELENHIKAHEAAHHPRYIIPDQFLGWTISPSGKHHTCPYTADERGYRNIPFTRRANTSTFILGFFGDSFIHGDEVNDEDAALSQLQRLTDGLVINGGVSGYGTDQAVMRLERDSDALSCKWLFLGIATCDETRNINVLRLHHSPQTAIPYMKPRFVERGEDLEVVYPPPVGDRSLRAHYLDRDTRRFLKKYDAFYPRNQFLTWLMQVSSSESDYAVLRRAQQQCARQMTLRVVHRFRKFIQARGIKGTLLLLPHSKQLDRPSDLDFYRAAFRQAGYEFWDIAETFRARGYQRFSDAALWCKNGHFSALASQWVAEALAEKINTTVFAS